MNGMKPIFIGGCERSGTTMLGSMLGNHPNHLAIPESQFMTQIYSQHFSRDRFDPTRALELIGNHPRFQIWNLRIPQDFSTGTAVDSYVQLIEKLIRLYGKKVGNPDPIAWIDHTPSNVCHFSLLKELFDEASFVHIVRDGRAVAASILGLPDWPYVTVDRIAGLWLQRLACGLAAESFFGHEGIVRVRYEDVVQSPEMTLRDACSTLGIDYSRKMAVGSEYSVHEYNRHQHSLVGSSPNASRIAAWKESLKPRQIEIFESETHDVLSYLGYMQLYGYNARRITRTEKMFAETRHIVRGAILNRIRRWSRLRRSTRQEYE